MFQQIFENIGGADSAKANLIVRDHMLKNIFGFEYLIAPYTIAHLKLSQYLSDKEHALTGSTVYKCSYEHPGAAKESITAGDQRRIWTPRRRSRIAKSW